MNSNKYSGMYKSYEQYGYGKGTFTPVLNIYILSGVFIIVSSKNISHDICWVFAINVLRNMVQTNLCLFPRICDNRV